jgi:hypothetical protein
MTSTEKILAEMWENTLKFFITNLLNKQARGMTNTDIAAENQNELDSFSDEELVELNERLQGTPLKDLVYVYELQNMVG